jgi:hypothetical protein
MAARILAEIVWIDLVLAVIGLWVRAASRRRG